MSRVFSASWVLLAASCGRGPGLIVAVSEKAPGLASTASFQGCPNPKALSSIHRAAQLKWGLAPLPANAQLRLPVSAFLALFLQTWPVECLLLPPCCGHASCSPCQRAWQPGTGRPWQPRPSKGAYEALKGCPNQCAGCRSIVNF